MTVKVKKVMNFLGYPVYAGDIDTLAFSDPQKRITIHNCLLQERKIDLLYILLHEVAHIELGHIYELNMGALDIDKEVEADLWAYCHGANYQTIITFLEKECLKSGSEEELYGLNKYRLERFKIERQNLKSFQTYF